MKFNVDLPAALNSPEINAILAEPLTEARIEQEFAYIESRSFPKPYPEQDLVDTFTVALPQGAKNRGQNYSYDDVTLNVSTGYLNGGYAFDQKYVVGQMPTAETFPTFMQYMIENQVQAIVNLAQPSEEGYFDYLNAPGITYSYRYAQGGVYQYWLTYVNGDLEYELAYLSTVNWPNEGVLPSVQEANQLAMFLRLICSGQAFVHGLLGVGRAPTMIAIDRIEKALRAGTATKRTIFENVMTLRASRITAVNLEQYKFLYQAYGARLPQ